MSKQIINIGNIINDGAGDTLRVGATKINSNFTEIYSKLGNGTDISLSLDFTTPPTEGQVLQFNSLTGKFVPGEAGARGQIGPQGPQGATGPQGPQGLQGDGNVNGPTSSVNNTIVRFNGTNGKEIQGSTVTISNTGVIRAPIASSVIPFYHSSEGSLPSAEQNLGAVAVTQSEGKLYYASGTSWVPVAKEEDIITPPSILAGPGISIVEGSNTLTISAIAQNIGLNNINEIDTANITIDQFAHPAITRLIFSAPNLSAWQVESYLGANPTIYAISGTTIAFKIGTVVSGSNLTIQTTLGSNFNSGLYHVDIDGTVTTESAAQSKDTGTLYWRIPPATTGTFRYTCLGVPAMTGNIVIKDITAI